MKQPTRDLLWTTRSGEKIPLRRMADGHIRNAYRLLDAKVREIKETRALYHHPVFGPRGEIATSIIEQEIERYEELELILLGWLAAFEEEAKQRDLPLPPRTEPEPLPEYEHVGTGPGGVGDIWRLKDSEGATDEVETES